MEKYKKNKRRNINKIKKYSGALAALTARLSQDFTGYNLFRFFACGVGGGGWWWLREIFGLCFC